LVDLDIEFRISNFRYWIANFESWISNDPPRLLYRYIMFGRGICEKYQSRDERKISRAGRRGKFSLKIGIFRKYPSQTWYICL